MKVAIVGNVAQNAFLLAQGVRWLDAGIEADSYDQGGGYPLQVPYWQHLDFDPVPEHITAESEVWEWAQRGKRYGWQRPGWARILGNDGAEAAYVTQEDFEADLGRVIRGQRERVAEDVQRRDLAHALRLSRTPPESHGAVLEAARGLVDWRSVLAIAQQYGLVVLCGQYAAFGPLLPATQPYVTFEHATMRYTPSLATPPHRLLALAYRQSDANIITNADCWEAAGQLGVRDRSVFIPHPLDETQFTPGDPAVVAKHRARVAAQFGCERVFLAPARHSRSEATGSKRNDRILYAYARYVQEAEPAGAPRAVLLLAAWGHPEHVRESEALVRALGLADRVGWLPCLPKPRLLRWYRVADVVLDQFSETVGSFGAVTAEALAVGKPVVTYYSAEAHAWTHGGQGCADVLPEAPPLVSARTTDQVYRALVDLATDPERCAELGRDARRWVAEYHSLGRVAEKHAALYARVLARRADEAAASPPTVEMSTGGGQLVETTASATVEAAEGAAQTRYAFEYEHAHQDRSDLCAFGPQRITELLGDLDLPAEWFRGKRVLDAGCGGGRWSYALAELGAAVTAIDFTESGVAVTAAMLATYPDCRALQADLTTLDAPPPEVAAALPPASFDLVLSWGVLHHTERPEATFRQLVPLVKPGGFLYVMIYGPTSPTQDALTDVVRAALRPLSPEQRYEACRALVLDDPARVRALWPYLYVYYGDPADPVAYERALFACYDCYSPRWNHRFTHAEVAAWFTRAGLEVPIRTRPFPDAVHLRGRKPALRDSPTTVVETDCGAVGVVSA